MAFEAFTKGIAFPVTCDIKGLITGLGEADVKLTALEKTNQETFERGSVVVQGYGKAIAGVGIAMTGVGLGMEALIKPASVVNANLGVTGITIGKTTDEMRNLALETANVTFPLSKVTATFDLLAKAGMRNTDEMQKTAYQFDAIGDASGNTADQIANILIPAFAAFDIPLTEVGDHMDGLTYLTEHSNVTMEAFGSVIRTLGSDLSSIGFTFEDTEALLLAMSDAGIPAEKATRKLRSAVSEYKSAQQDATKAAQEAIDIGKDLTRQKENLADLERDYARDLQKAGDVSKKVAQIQLDYNKQIADSKKDIAKLEADYQKSLAKIQDTTKDEAKLKKAYDKDVASSAKDSAKLEAEYAKEILKAKGDPEKIAAIEERYAERRLNLQDRLSERTSDYNDRLAEIRDTTEAVTSLNERYAERKESAQERINEQTVAYNERLSETKDTTEAVAAVNERYAEKIANANTKIAETTQKFDIATSAAVNFQSGIDAMLAKLNLTPEAFAAAQRRITDESAGATEQYADQMNTRYTFTDKVKQVWDEFALSMGSALIPFQLVGTALSITGPLMMGLGGLLYALPMLSTTAIPALMSVLTLLAAHPIILVIAGLILLFVVLETKFGLLSKAAALLGQGWDWLSKNVISPFIGWLGKAVKGIDWIGLAFHVLLGPIALVYDAIKFLGANWESIWNTMTSIAKAGINWLIDGINLMVRALNLLNFKVPSWVPLIGGQSIGFNLPTIPRLASGAIVTSPTIAMVGEAGPEAIVPLSRGGAGAGVGEVNLNFYGPMNVRNDQDIKLIAQELHTLITRENRGRGTTG